MANPKTNFPFFTQCKLYPFSLVKIWKHGQILLHKNISKTDPKSIQSNPVKPAHFWPMVRGLIMTNQGLNKGPFHQSEMNPIAPKGIKTPVFRPFGIITLSHCDPKTFNSKHSNIHLHVRHTEHSFSFEHYYCTFMIKILNTYFSE